MPYEQERDAALHAARLAGRTVRQLYDQFEVIPNAPASITTDADRESQEIILQALRRAFPDDALCAEETTATLAETASTGARLWIVDPIDGTRGFARKNGEFSIMIGFVHEGKIAVGVVLEPARDRLTYAVRGQGCWRRDGQEARETPCHVTSVDQLAQATLTQSHVRQPGQLSALVQALQPKRILESYSAGVKLALVARGEADLYLNDYDKFHDWDICAGQILVEEAGGRVTGVHGEELQYGLPGAWQRHGLLGSNGRLHVEALRRLDKSPTD